MVHSVVELVFPRIIGLLIRISNAKPADITEHPVTCLFTQFAEVINAYGTQPYGFTSTCHPVASQIQVGGDV